MALKKITLADLDLKTDGLPDEQKKFMDNIGTMMVNTINKALDGNVDTDEINKLISENDKMKSFDTEKFDEVCKSNTELIEQVKSMGETIEKLKQKGVSMDTISKFDEKLTEMFESERFKDFADGRKSKSGTFEFARKDITSLENNYAGEILITQQQKRVIDPFANGVTHMRDVMTIEQGDPEFPNVCFNQISELDRNVRYETENGRLKESSFKVKEITAPVKRLGTTLFISKRMLKSRLWVRSYVLQHLPQWIMMAEDWGILFGDGTGENFDGISLMKDVKPVEDIIKEDVVVGVAGDVDSVKEYDGGNGCIVEFTKPQPWIRTGMSVTFTGAAVCTDLNSKQTLIKMTDRQILVKDAAYAGAETAVAAMTFKVNNQFFQNIDTPNSEDVIRTAFAMMSYAEYVPNAIVMNPSDVNAIASEKDTTGRNLGLVKVVNGVKYIAERAIIESTQIPFGMYFLGDFNNGASLIDYTPLYLEWAEDVETKRRNMVALIAQEEAILAVYNPFSFAYGNLEDLKTAITK